MKLQKIAVIGLFALSFAGISAGAAQAADIATDNQIIIDCVTGYEAVYTADGSSGTCEPMATTFEAPLDPESSCVPNNNPELDCVVLYNALPSEADDPAGLDENGNPIPIMEKGIDLMAASGMPETKSADNSETLTAAGVLVAAAGAFAIAISRRKIAKK